MDLEPAPYPWALPGRSKHQKTPYLLTEHDPRAHPPPAVFKGELWQPQATMLYALLWWERHRTIAERIFVRRGPGTQDVLVSRFSNVVRVSSQFSTGKTVLCLALVAAQPVPPAYPISLPMEGFSVELKFGRIIPATLVLVTNNVLGQWVENAAKFAPGLKVVAISNVYSFRKFISLFDQTGLRDVDIVILKVGGVTSKVFDGLKMDEEELSAYASHNDYTCRTGQKPAPAKTYRTVAAMAAVTAGHAWARLVIDDYDIVPLAQTDPFLPALSTILVSATSNPRYPPEWVCSMAGLPDHQGAARRAKYVERVAATYRLAHYISDKAPATVECAKEYLDAFVSTKKSIFQRVVLSGGAEHLAYLKHFGVSPRVIEMVASGALSSASDAMGGVKGVKSGYDLFRIIVTGKTYEYKRIQKQIALIERILAASKNVRSSIADKQFQTPTAIISMVEKNVDMDDTDVSSIADTLTPSTRRGLATLYESLLDKSKQANVLLSRLNDNISEDACQVCSLEIQGGGYTTKCCQLVICKYCINMNNTQESTKKITKCPNCMRDLKNFGADFTPIGDITSAKEIIQHVAPLTNGAPDTPDAPDELAALGSRMRCLVRLMRGERDRISDLVCVVPVPNLVTGLIDGRDVAVPPEKNAPPQKVLVFTGYAESSAAIAQSLRGLGVACLRLRGSVEGRAKQVKEFKSATTDIALVVTSVDDSAGLHLPETTKVIFYHHHSNDNIRRQAVGRAHRVGRKYSLEVFEIINEGEKTAFKL